jgi:hypothetical protein
MDGKMKKLAAPLFFFVCIAPMLSAQEFSYGAQVSTALPLGDAGEKRILNHRPGLGLGLHGIWHFYQGQALVPRIDVMLYQRDIDGNDPFALPFRDSYNLKDIKAGVDYNIILNNDGLYGIAGVGFSSFEWLIIADPTDSILAREDKRAMYFSIGVGYTMTERFLAELRYVHASYSNVGSSLGTNGKSFTAPAITFSLLWRR